MKEVPIWEKSNLTLEEAAAYSGIGINKLRTLTDNEHCQFVLWVGSKRLIKRRKLDEYTEKCFHFKSQKPKCCQNSLQKMICLWYYKYGTTLFSALLCGKEQRS